MEIPRDIIARFIEWKESDSRKPILLKGAHQIGKSWAMEKFGHDYYKHVVKFDFDKQPELKNIFETTKEPERIIKELSLYTEYPILPKDT